MLCINRWNITKEVKCQIHHSITYSNVTASLFCNNKEKLLSRIKERRRERITLCWLGFFPTTVYKNLWLAVRDYSGSKTSSSHRKGNLCKQFSSVHVKSFLLMAPQFLEEGISGIRPSFHLWLLLFTVLSRQIQKPKTRLCRRAIQNRSFWLSVTSVFLPLLLFEFNHCSTAIRSSSSSICRRLEWCFSQ